MPQALGERRELLGDQLRDRRAGMQHVGGGEQEALQVRGARRAVAREVESVGTCGRPEVAVLQPILARQRGEGEQPDVPDQA